MKTLPEELINGFILDKIESEIDLKSILTFLDKYLVWANSRKSLNDIENIDTLCEHKIIPLLTYNPELLGLTYNYRNDTSVKFKKFSAKEFIDKFMK